MKIKHHNTTTVISSYSGVPKINFGKTGAININKAACEIIGLQAGDVIEFIQDEEKPADWYIRKDVLHGWKLRNMSPGAGTRGLGFSCKALVKEVWESLELRGDESIKCLVSPQPFKVPEMDFDLWPIITKSAAPTRRGEAASEKRTLSQAS